MDNEQSVVIRLSLGEHHKLTRGGKALLVIHNWIVGVGDVLASPVQFGRGASDDEIAEAWLESADKKVE